MICCTLYVHSLRNLIKLLVLTSQGLVIVSNMQRTWNIYDMKYVHLLFGLKSIWSTKLLVPPGIR
jgi:hypothetical protein